LPAGCPKSQTAWYVSGVSSERASSESPESDETAGAAASEEVTRSGKTVEQSAGRPAAKPRTTRSTAEATGEQTGEKMAGRTGEDEAVPSAAQARSAAKRPGTGAAKTAAAAASPTTRTTPARTSRTTSSGTRTPKATPVAEPAEDAPVEKPAPKTRAPRSTATRSSTVRTAAGRAAVAVSEATVTQTESPVAETPAIETTATIETPAIESTETIEAPAIETIAPEPESAALPAPEPGAAARPAVASVLSLSGLYKRFGDTIAVDGVSLEVAEGSFYGIVGPNGAGKTTTLSMVTGLLRPDAGRVLVHGLDAWADPIKAKRAIGVLPDKLRLFDRLTGAQLLHYSGTLRGLSAHTVRSRTADLATAFGIEDALDRLVADYSAGMTKKIALAAAMIHSPRLLVLDEPFESVDPVSAANVIDILQRYVRAGGTVVLSSHGMDLIQRVCDSVAIIVRGQVLAAGTIDEVRGEQTLEERFVELAGGRKAAEGMEWLHSFSD
jgi:ABC-2 type transport system ATP-binding protein